jgi:hypothetical protein
VILTREANIFRKEADGWHPVNHLTLEATVARFVLEGAVFACTVTRTYRGVFMDDQGFLAALSPAMTDAQARERFLADPRGFLAAAGFDLPESVTVTAREGDAAELTITLPGLLDPNADLSDESLAMASGGWMSHWTPPSDYPLVDGLPRGWPT